LYQSSVEKQNGEALALARVALQKFRVQFPRSEEITEAECVLIRLEEVYAERMYQMGVFYEGMSLPCSAVVYYSCGWRQFPTTQAAQCCLERLQALKRYAPPCLYTVSVDS
jgi:outer membrane protein assembly factor BamD (BamD/ComL family)